MNDSLGDRMKAYYEARSKTKLVRRIPVIIRLDGKAFHTFTRGFKKPFDMIMTKAMQETMKYLCENIQGCVLGYTQSDEITLVLIDYQNLNSDAWFDYEVQKLCSVSASMATFAFNRNFAEIVHEMCWKGTIESDELISVYKKAIKAGALFDARCFNIPKEEVANCIIWRQQDATRNSIFSLARTLFSHNELQGLDSNQLQSKIYEEHGVNWNELETQYKRGSCCIKSATAIPDRMKWVIDNEIPIFTENRDYIENLLKI